MVLVRHGETTWSASGRHTGRTDLPLTEQGAAQAAALPGMLAPLLGTAPPVLALTSPLQRAASTAAALGIDADPEPDLMEIDYGAYEGLTTPQIRESAPGWTVWSGSCPDGESLDQVAARADRVLDRVRAALEREGAGGDGGAGPERSSTAVLVAHGHLLRLLTARWLGLPPTGGSMLALGTASVCVLATEHENPVLRHWNLPNPLGERRR